MYSRCRRNIHHCRTLVQNMLQPCPALRSEASSFSSAPRLCLFSSRPYIPRDRGITQIFRKSTSPIRGFGHTATVELRKSLGNPLVPFEGLGTPSESGRGKGFGSMARRK